MKDADLLALRQARHVCQGHADVLRDVLEDMDAQTSAHPLVPDKSGKRLLDQFAYRYTRLQDDMGARLFPAALRVLGEEIESMPVLDRLNRLEQLGWQEAAEEWMELRRVRNEFTHDYPESAEEREERDERLTLAISAARRLREILSRLDERLRARLPAL